MAKKYKLTHRSMKAMDGCTLHQIKALKDFGNVKEGDLGGWVESYDNLSQTGLAWVYDNARVYGNAYVYGNAEIYGDARVCGNARVYGNAYVYEYALVCDDAMVEGNSQVYNYSLVCNDARVSGNAQVYGRAQVFGRACVYDSAKVYGYSSIGLNIYIRENDEIKDSNSYLVFNNTWSSGRDFVYVLSNHRWHVGCFDGSGEELIKKAYADSELSGKMYELYVHFAEQVVKEQQLNKDKNNVQ